MEPQWFESWFDSPYYPILYNHRNDEEAENFIQFLANQIPIQKQEHWVDLACGRGRHARFLQQFCYQVTGLDLSKESILDAQKFENENLSFQVADMRTFQLNNTVDGFLNLFTSFGYFQQTSDNLSVLKQINQHLKPHGKLVIDFLNEMKVRSELIEYQEIIKNNILFKVTKKIEDGKVCKTIDFTDDGKNFHFEETVQLFGIQEFTKMLTESGFAIINIWGDYAGSDFTKQSPRLIILSQKSN